MAKVRVYELAKELGVESKTLLTYLKDKGEFVRSASSTIEPPVVRTIKESFPAGAARCSERQRKRPRRRCRRRRDGARAVDRAAVRRDAGRRPRRLDDGGPRTVHFCCVHPRSGPGRDARCRSARSGFRPACGRYRGPGSRPAVHRGARRSGPASGGPGRRRP